MIDQKNLPGLQEALASHEPRQKGRRLHRRTWLLLVFFLWTPALFGEPRKIDLTLTDIDGQSHAMADYSGQWVAVHVWATWCRVCIGELPELIAFQSAHQDRGAVVLGVHYDPINAAILRTFAQQHRINFPLFSGAEATEIALGPLNGVPKTFLIAPDNTLRVIFYGPVTREELEKEMVFH